MTIGEGEGPAELVQLCLLAVLQGLTEFLPVSSSGHLVLGQAVLRMEESGLGLDVCLHVGTLLAVLVVYRRDLVALVADARRGALGEPLLLALAVVPAAVVGLVFDDAIKDLFGDVRAAAMGLCVTAGILVAGEVGRRRQGSPGREQVGPWIALAIGLAQALAIIPGISRSGATIACALLAGLSPRAAARFSFLLAIPTILGAAVLELPGALNEETGVGWGALLFATLVAGVVGWAALRMLLAFLNRGAFVWFALYCLCLGGGVLVFSGGSA